MQRNKDASCRFGFILPIIDCIEAQMGVERILRQVYRNHIQLLQPENLIILMEHSVVKIRIFLKFVCTEY